TVQRIIQQEINVELTSDQVHNLARLTRIGPETPAIDAHADTLSRMLEFFAPIAAVATEHIEPMVHPPHGGTQLRPDAATERDQREALQALAPATADGLYLVPKVIE